MEQFKLSFCKIIKLDKDMAEIIVNDGVEMDALKAIEYHGFLTEILETPYLVLVNKKNKYTYSYKGQKELLVFKEVKAMALITYTSKDTVIINSLKNMPFERTWSLEVFSDREAALAWLIAQRT